MILGLGAYRLLRRNVLVRRLNAEETLGSVDLIITDKTGTLTRNRLDVASVSDLAGPVEGTARVALLEAALRAEDDAWVRAEGTAPGSFTASLGRAIEAAGGRAVLDPADLLASEPVIDGRPVSITRSRVRDVARAGSSVGLGSTSAGAAARSPRMPSTSWPSVRRRPSSRWSTCRAMSAAPGTTCSKRTPRPASG